LIPHRFLTGRIAPCGVTLDRRALRLPGRGAEPDRQRNQHGGNGDRHPAIAPQDPAEHIQPGAGPGGNRLPSQCMVNITLQGFDGRVPMRRLPAHCLGHDRIEVATQQTR
jgi:hypothetical protein